MELLWLDLAAERAERTGSVKLASEIDALREEVKAIQKDSRRERKLSTKILDRVRKVVEDPKVKRVWKWVKKALLVALGATIIAVFAYWAKKGWKPGRKTPKGPNRSDLKKNDPVQIMAAAFHEPVAQHKKDVLAYMLWSETNKQGLHLHQMDELLKKLGLERILGMPVFNIIHIIVSLGKKHGSDVGSFSVLSEAVPTILKDAGLKDTKMSTQPGVTIDNAVIAWAQEKAQKLVADSLKGERGHKTPDTIKKISKRILEHRDECFRYMIGIIVAQKNAPLSVRDKLLAGKEPVFGTPVLDFDDLHLGLNQSEIRDAVLHALKKLSMNLHGIDTKKSGRMIAAATNIAWAREKAQKLVANHDLGRRSKDFQTLESWARAGDKVAQHIVDNVDEYIASVEAFSFDHGTLEHGDIGKKLGWAAVDAWCIRKAREVPNLRNARVGEQFRVGIHIGADGKDERRPNARVSKVVHPGLFVDGSPAVIKAIVETSAA